MALPSLEETVAAVISCRNPTRLIWSPPTDIMQGGGIATSTAALRRNPILPTALEETRSVRWDCDLMSAPLM